MPIAAPTYIRLSRHNVYYFRWPLPAYIHPQSKISHVEASLGTRNPKEALRLARRLEYYANRFNDILVSNIMSHADAQKVSSSLLLGLLWLLSPRAQKLY